MPAERWHSGIHDFLQSMGETDEDFIRNFMTSALSRIPKKDDDPAAPETGDKNEGQRFPDILPILPLRGVVVYP
ncbi:MAG: hypothetical protein HYZ23_05450, partial [Chloroflexi bacterium]|nr:hypothetical protein [Chloroflexota bacterium]